MIICMNTAVLMGAMVLMSDVGFMSAKELMGEQMNIWGNKKGIPCGMSQLVKKDSLCESAWIRQKRITKTVRRKTGACSQNQLI